jgi:hypothetical protein
VREKAVWHSSCAAAVFFFHWRCHPIVLGHISCVAIQVLVVKAAGFY